MARSRLLKPDFFDDEKLAELPFEARLLFESIWTQADREGRLLDRPQKLAAAAFPYDNPLQVAARINAPAMLNALIAGGMVERYEAGGLALLYIPSWKKHQKIHPNEALSTLPAPPEETIGNQCNPMIANVAGYGIDTDTDTESTSTSDTEGDAPADAAPAPEAEPEEIEVAEKPKRSRKHSLKEAEDEIPRFREEHPTVDVPREWLKFTNHLKAKAKTYTDYIAAFENWLLNEERYAAERGLQTTGRSAGGRQRGSPGGPDVDGWDRYAAGQN